MKIRTGFVSNSSSSSFCIVGVGINSYRDDIDKMMKDSNCFYLSDFFENNYIAYNYINDIEYGAIGISIHMMLSSETLLQFKERSLAHLNKILPNLTIDRIEIIVDGGYDG